MSKNHYENPDARTRAAKAQGYPARSVWKLEEIDKRVRLLKQGQRVLDLGAAPGSWSLYAASKVGSGGRVLAIDRNPILQVFPPNVQVALGDALTLETAELSTFAPYDVVLSDMAPNTTGSKAADQARSFELFIRAVDVAKEVSVAGGAFVGKIFMSGDFQAARAAVAAVYGKVQAIKPEGTRKISSELFLIGLHKR